MAIQVLKARWITRENVQANPDKAYLFGDNLLRTGNAGQAKQMRGEPNAIGIPTKNRPSSTEGSYFTDKDFEKVKPEIDKALKLAMKYKTIVVPQMGIGTGLAQLKFRAPRIFEYIETSIENLTR